MPYCVIKFLVACWKYWKSSFQRFTFWDFNKLTKKYTTEAGVNGANPLVAMCWWHIATNINPEMMNGVWWGKFRPNLTKWRVFEIAIFVFCLKTNVPRQFLFLNVPYQPIIKPTVFQCNLNYPNLTKRRVLKIAFFRFFWLKMS